MSLSVDTLKARTAGAAVTTTEGLNVGGACTATSFVGDGAGLTGVASTDNIITGVAVTIGGILKVTDTTQSTSATTGSVIISGGVGIAKTLTVGGNVSVGGTLTYEDVTNVDSVGLITARSGIQFGAAGVGGTIRANGDTTLVGVVTATGGFVGNLTGASSLIVVTAENTTAATVYPLFAGNGATATGNLDASTDTGLTYNPSTGELTSEKFTGNGSGLTGLNIPAGFTELDAALFN